MSSDFGPSRPVLGLLVSCAVCASLGGTSRAQTDAAVSLDDVFEEIVLMRRTPGAPPSVEPEDARQRPASRTIVGRGASLKSLIGWAYPLEQWQITGGPDWIEQRMFDVIVVFKPGVEGGDRAEGLRRLWAERFELEVHRETAPIFVLDTLDGSPARLEPSSPDSGELRSSLDEAPGRIAGVAVTTGALADALSRYLRGPVLNRTALTGRYDFVLEWPLERPLEESLADVSGAAAHPRLVDALASRLGLELRSVPLEMLVVDHASDEAPATD